MKLKQAVEETPDAANAYHPGLQAIPRRDSRRMGGAQTSKLAGSVNLDEAVEGLYPNASRWDYCIGFVVNQQSDRVIWVEVHPASTSNVKEMAGKLNWLKRWLNASAPRIEGLGRTQFYWITSGSVNISKASRQARALAQSGIRFPTKYLDLGKCQTRE